MRKIIVGLLFISFVLKPTTASVVQTLQIAVVKIADGANAGVYQHGWNGK